MISHYIFFAVYLIGATFVVKVQDAHTDFTSSGVVHFQSSTLGNPGRKEVKQK